MYCFIFIIPEVSSMRCRKISQVCKDSPEMKLGSSTSHNENPSFVSYTINAVLWLVQANKVYATSRYHVQKARQRCRAGGGGEGSQVKGIVSVINALKRTQVSTCVIKCKEACRSNVAALAHRRGFLQQRWHLDPVLRLPS